MRRRTAAAFLPWSRDTRHVFHQSPLFQFEGLVKRAFGATLSYSLLLRRGGWECHMRLGKGNKRKETEREGVAGDRNDWLPRCQGAKVAS